ncbi:MAG: response regulator [Thermodesulfobacteriota bacterium]
MEGYPANDTTRVVVVDDDEDFGEFLAEALGDEGHKTAVYAEPHRALSAAAARGFELAFVDVNIPDMPGAELAEKLMIVHPGIQVVLMSSRGDVGTVLKALQIGAYDFLTKPFSRAELAMCLTRCRERRALRRHLELAEQRHFTLIQNIPLLIIRLNEDLAVEFVNQACRQMLGEDPGDAIREDGWLLNRIHERDRPVVERVLSRAFTAGGPLSAQCRLRHAKGYYLHGILKSMSAPPGMEDPLGRYLDCIFVDISERVYMESLMVQDEKLKTLGAITKEVAHELRNPLMSIGGFARRLSAKAPDYPEAEIILRESERLERLLDRIHGYLSPVQATPREVDMNAALAQALESGRPALSEHGLRLESALTPDLPSVDADPALLDEIFAILMQDAAKALAPGGALSVRTYLAASRVCVAFRYLLVEIKGMDAERLYMPFEEGGFGLPKCYRLVQRMGGVLTLTREEDHAVFTVCLRPAQGDFLPETPGSCGEA